MPPLNFESIQKAAKSVPLTPVEVKEWGGMVFVRPMTVYDRERFEDLLVSQRDNLQSSGIRATLLAACCCDQNGARIFQTDEQIDFINTLSASAVDRVIEAIKKVNSLGDKLEDAKKNSEVTSPNDSSSDSP